jgi:hypothetical protein
MAKFAGIRRRNFLVGTGVVVAHTALAGRSARAGSSAPAAPPDPPVAPTKPPAPAVVNPKPGIAPGYIISGRGQDLGNPYFHPLGGPSNQRMPTPPEAHGKGVSENDQGGNQQ